MNIALLGCGHMARALFLPAIGKATFHIYTPSGRSAEEFARAVSGRSWKNLQDIPPCDFYVLACKPQHLSRLAPRLAPLVSPEGAVVSILAGVSLARLGEYFGHRRLARVMPNLPNSVGRGVNAVCFDIDFSPEDRLALEKLLSSTGRIWELSDEGLIDPVTVVSGCGPAYVFELARILEEDLCSRGVKEARSLVAHTLYGSAKMLLQADEDPTQLRRRVTSRGGVTEAALAVLDGGLQELFKRALAAARDRAGEL